MSTVEMMDENGKKSESDVLEKITKDKNEKDKDLGKEKTANCNEKSEKEVKVKIADLELL